MRLGVGLQLGSQTLANRSLLSLFAGGQQGLLLEVVQSGGFSPALLFAGGQEGLLFEPEG